MNKWLVGGVGLVVVLGIVIGISYSSKEQPDMQQEAEEVDLTGETPAGPVTSLRYPEDYIRLDHQTYEGVDFEQYMLLTPPCGGDCRSFYEEHLPMYRGDNCTMPCAVGVWDDRSAYAQWIADEQSPPITDHFIVVMDSEGNFNYTPWE